MGHLGIRIALAGALALGASAASAATITLGGFVTTGDNTLAASPTPSVTVTDLATGGVGVEISSSGILGTITGLAFDVSGVSVSAGDIDPTSIIVSTKKGLEFANDVTKIGNANFQGGFPSPVGTNPVFDFLFALDKVDVSSVPLSFSITTPGLDTTDFESVGVRFQQVGTTTAFGGGSSKLISTTVEIDPELPNVSGQVPLPAAGWLMIAGIGGLAAMRRRRA